MEVKIVNHGVSYMREIVKFNDLKATLRVQLVRGGGQYARKYGKSLLCCVTTMVRGKTKP